MLGIPEYWIVDFLNTRYINLRINWAKTQGLRPLRSANAIEAISWWDFTDAGCFWPFGGLLDRNMQPKEAFYRLKNLLAQWRYR
jgi:hypothetical protein